MKKFSKLGSSRLYEMNVVNFKSLLLLFLITNMIKKVVLTLSFLVNLPRNYSYTILKFLFG